jgi:hypothetical protein
VSAHIQLAIVFAGVLACLAHLFGGIFSSEPGWFFAGPIALLAMIPVIRRPRIAATTSALWLLALAWCGSYFDQQMHHSGDGDLLEVLEWAMLVVLMRRYLRTRESVVV